MSRALDKQVIEALKSGDPTAAYNDISELLDLPPPSDDGTDNAGGHDSRLEIELLPSSHPLEPGVHFLREDNAVAIPKLRLVQAFFVARKILFEDLSSSSPSTQPWSQSSLDDNIAAAKVTAVRRATGVILLMDPEHLTAVNTRKRLLLAERGRRNQGHATRGLSHTSREELLSSEEKIKSPSDLLKRERRFLDSLLTSHLNRHTKSPTLWSHRRWLLENLQPLPNEESIPPRGGVEIQGKYYSDKVPDGVVEDIRDVVMVAGTRHPRNYYAWSHARWIVRRWIESRKPYPTRAPPPTPPVPPAARMGATITVVGVKSGATAAVAQEEHSGDPSISERDVDTGEKRVMALVKEWCLRNHTDTSGWSFLYFVVAALELPPGYVVREVFGDVIRLTNSLRWTNESVWVFLRTVAAAQDMVGVGWSAEMVRQLEKGVEEIGPLVVGEGKGVLDAAVRWVREEKGRQEVKRAAVQA